MLCKIAEVNKKKKTLKMWIEKIQAMDYNGSSFSECNFKIDLEIIVDSNSR